MKCPICSHENREDLELELLQGFPKEKMAEQLQCSKQAIQNHMRNHFDEFIPQGDVNFTPKVQKGNKKDSKKDKNSGKNQMRKRLYEPRESYRKFDVLQTNMHRLVDRFDTLLEKDHLDKDDTRQIIESAREIRQTVMNLAELEGELKQELEFTRAQFEELKEAIIRILSPEDQEKIIRVIDESNVKIEAEE